MNKRKKINNNSHLLSYYMSGRAVDTCNRRRATGFQTSKIFI